MNVFSVGRFRSTTPHAVLAQGRPLFGFPMISAKLSRMFSFSLQLPHRNNDILSDLRYIQPPTLHYIVFQMQSSHSRDHSLKVDLSRPDFGEYFTLG